MIYCGLCTSTRPNLGNAYARLGDAPKAIEFSKEALGLARKLDDPRSTCAALGNLGSAYAALGDMPSAIELSEQALKIAHEIDDRHSACAVLGILGNTYVITGEVQKAIERYREALDVARELGDLSTVGFALTGLGVAYKHLGDIAQAIQYYRQALDVVRETHNQRSDADIRWNIGLLLSRHGELREALQYLEESLAFYQKIRHPSAMSKAEFIARLRAQVAPSDDESKSPSLSQRSMAVDSGDREQAGSIQDAWPDQVRQDEPRAYRPQQAGHTTADERARLIASLPDSVHSAILQRDPHALHRALEALPPEQYQKVIERLQQAQLVDTPPHHDQILQNFLPFLGDIALAAFGDTTARQLAEAALPQFEERGWRLERAARRIWAGERDVQRLIEGVDANSAALIQRTLRMITDGQATIAVAHSIRLAQIRRQAELLTTRAQESGDAARQADAISWLEEVAVQLEQQESPWLELAVHLRKLVASLTSG